MKWLDSWVMFRDAHSFEASVVIWFLHALVVVLTAWLIAEVITRRFTAIRYGIWIITCTSLLAMAVLNATAFPLSINLHVLPIANSSLIEETTSVRAISAPMQTADNLNALPNWTPESFAGTDLHTAPESAASEPVDTNKNENALVQFPRPSLYVLAVSVYALGVLLFALRLLASYRRLLKIKRQSAPISASQFDLARDCAIQLGLAKHPVFLQSDEVAVPMAFGIFRPTVIVPASLESSDKSRQRHCFLHELAHIRHRDGLWNLMNEITRAVYWFHPAVYVACRKLIQTREYAADDRVLRVCSSPASYTQTILALSRSAGTKQNTTLEMGATSHMEHRIRRILKPKFRLRQLPKWVLLFPAAFVVAIAMCSLQFEQAIAQPPKDKNTDTDVADIVRESANYAADEHLLDDLISIYDRFDSVIVDDGVLGNVYDATVSGRVTDEQGAIADAIVLIRIAPARGRRAEKIPVVSRVRTDRDGRYKARFTHTALSSRSKSNCVEILVADKRGRLAMDMRKITRSSAADHSLSVNVMMNSAKTLQAVIHSEAGKPIEDAAIHIRSAFALCNSTRGDPFAGSGLSNPRSDPFVSGARMHEFQFPSNRIMPTFQTKSDGVFKFAGAESVVAVVEKEGLYTRTPELYAKTSQVGRGRDKLHSPATVTLAQEIRLTSRVTDRTGKSISKFKVGFAYLGPKQYYWGQRQLKDGSIVTAETYLRDLANDDGQLRFALQFPPESGLIPVQKQIDLEELLRDRKLTGVTESGVWITGRVVKHDTGSPLARAWVDWSESESSHGPTLHSTTLDSNGNWKLLTPRKRGFISIRGMVPGYDLGGGLGIGKTRPELIQKVVPNDTPNLRLPDFRVRPIAPRAVVVVNANGQPIHGANVTAEHTSLVRGVDGKIYPLSGSTLAMDSETDKSGQCQLKLMQRTWKEGIVKASHTFYPDDSQSRRDIRYQSGYAKIEPNSADPIRIVMRDHIWVKGKALVGGKPYPAIRVGLAKRGRRSNDSFNTFHQGFSQTEKGEFEILMDPQGEYALMLCLLADESHGERHYYRQTPIAQPPDSFDPKTEYWDVGTIDVQLGQFKEAPSK